VRSTTARLRDIRRRRSVGRSLNGWNGLVFEAGRLVVFVEIGLQGEGLVTSLAVEVLESRMGLHVSSKIGPVSKRFTTVGTAVGLVSSVGSHVSLQQPGTTEGFPAHLALVVEVVGEDVHGQGGHADVHLVTDVALLGVVGV